MKKILFHTNSSWTLYHFRSALMRAMHDYGFEVVACGPPDEFAEKIEALGIRFLGVPINLAGMNPFRELKTIDRLYSIYRRERPDAVHHFSLKPIIYGSAAARLAKVPFIFNTVTGLGVSFGRRGVLQDLVKGLWRVACPRRIWTSFQNENDLNDFVSLHLVQRDRATIVRGSGVDSERFQCSMIPPQQSNGGPLTFLMLSRMLWSKGVGEYVEAAKMVQTRLRALGRGEVARFMLVGGAPAGNPTGVKSEWLVNPETIPGAWLEEKARQGTIEYYPHDDNVVDYIAKADVVVLPSYYREGVPRCLLEAMSCGRAIITTNTPGCLDLVEAGRNGLLVEPRSAPSLAEAFLYFIEHPGEAAAMGRHSRRLVLERFSDKCIIRQTVEWYERAGLGVSRPLRSAAPRLNKVIVGEEH